MTHPLYRMAGEEVGLRRLAAAYVHELAFAWVTPRATVRTRLEGNGVRVLLCYRWSWLLVVPPLLGWWRVKRTAREQFAEMGVELWCKVSLGWWRRGTLPRS